MGRPGVVLHTNLLSGKVWFLCGLSMGATSRLFFLPATFVSYGLYLVSESGLQISPYLNRKAGKTAVRTYSTLFWISFDFNDKLSVTPSLYWTLHFQVLKKPAGDMVFTNLLCGDVPLRWGQGILITNKHRNLMIQHGACITKRSDVAFQVNSVSLVCMYKDRLISRPFLSNVSCPSSLFQTEAKCKWMKRSLHSPIFIPKVCTSQTVIELALKQRQKTTQKWPI